MSVVIPQSLPNKWSWSKNPIVMSFYNPGDTTARLRFEVYIADRYAATGWTLVFQGSQSFSSRVTLVELQRILDSSLTYYHNRLLTNDSVYTDDIIPGVIYEGQTCKYQVKYGLSSEAYSSWATTTAQWCIKGGTSIDGWQKNLAAINDDSDIPFVLHQGLYMQYNEAPVQISLLYKGGLDGLSVTTYDASDTLLSTYTFSLPNTLPYGAVIHLSMKLDLTGVAYLKYNCKPTITLPFHLPWQPIAAPQVMPALSNYRMYSYINSMGGTDTVIMLWNRIETLNYEEQVNERAAPINADNGLNPMVYAETLSDRRERMVMNGDVSMLMKFFDTKYYDLLINALRQLCTSPDIREFEWGFWEQGFINRDTPILGSSTWSGFYLRYIPITITNTNTQSIIIGNTEQLPDAFTLEVTRSASNSQFLANQRSSPSDHNYAIMPGGERYARMMVMIDSDLFNYTLASTHLFAPRVAIDAGDGRYLWNTAAVSYATTGYRVVNLDFYYQPQIPEYTFTIDQTGQNIKAISGQIPAGTIIFTAENGPIAIFDALLPSSLVELHLANNYLSVMPMLVVGMTKADLTNNEISNLTPAQIAAIVAAYQTVGFNLSFNTNNLTQGDMDNLLVALDLSGYTGGLLDLRIQNMGASPTSIGYAAAANMTGTKSWDINF